MRYSRVHPDGMSLHVVQRSHNRATANNRRLYRQLQNVSKLPRCDQEAPVRTIDAFLSKAS